MTLTIKNLLLLEKKIGELDYKFLQKNKSKLSYCNPYFLVCLNEVICRSLNGTAIYDESLSMDNLLAHLNSEAKQLYLNSNISEFLETAM